MATEMETKTSKEVPITNPDHIRSVYANTIGVSATSNDVRIFFTDLGSDPTENGAAEQQLRAYLVVPVDAAKNLSNLLVQMVRQIETVVKLQQAKENNRVEQ